MNDRPLDIVALGSCYVDTNCEDYPFKEIGIPVKSELVGGRYEVTLGGSAVNFCSLLQTLGLRTAFVGMAGYDSNGDVLADLLASQSIQPELIRKHDIQTNIGFNMTSSEGRHIMCVAGTGSAALTPEAVMPKLESLMPTAKMLYLGGYFKLKSLTSAFSGLAGNAQKFGTTIVLDHGRIPEGTSDDTLGTLKELVSQAAYYFPSRNEFCELWGVGDIEEGLRLLSSKMPDLVAVVKDSGNGAYYFSEGMVKHAEAVKIDKVLHATGAGDSFNAGVITALAKGSSLDEAVVYGCRVAAAHITREALPSYQA